MLKKLRSSIAYKAFTIGLLAMLCIIVPLFFTASKSLEELGRYASSVNQKHIKELSESYLKEITLERARNYDQFFSKVQTVSSMIARQAATIYCNQDRFSSNPLKEALFTKQASNSIFYTQKSEPVITAYFGGQEITPEIRNELLAITHLEPLMVKAKQAVPECLASHIITVSGIGTYYTTNPDAYQAIFELPNPADFDIRDGEPVTMFSGMDAGEATARWTNIYKDDVIDGLMMTASCPVYDAKKRFVGITGMDIPLATIIDRLTGPTSFFTRPGSGPLFAFLLGRDGRIIAFPDEYLGLFGLRVDASSFKNSSDILNYSLVDSSIGEVQDASAEISNSSQGLIKMTLADEGYVLTFCRLATIGWRIVIVTREGDLISSVHRTEAEMKRILNLVWLSFIKYSGVIIIIGILFVLQIIRRFIAPIRELTRTTQNVARGDLSAQEESDQPSAAERLDEIGTLTRSFAIMVRQLKHSASVEKQYQETLEAEIRQRTSDLDRTNKELMDIKAGLEALVALRTEELKQLNEYLILAEERERKAIAADLHDSVAQNLGISVSKLKTMIMKDEPIVPEHLLEIQDILESAIRESRLLIYQLRPPILEDFDFEIALGWLIEETNTKRGMEITYINNLEKETCFGETTKVGLYRIVSELITNIIKHSGTRKAEIEISDSNEFIHLRVKDRGKGFEPSTINRDIPTGFGLFSILERVRHLGGSADILSHPGKGTTITLIVPARSGF